jgi:hypothetical protein
MKPSEPFILAAAMIGITSLGTLVGLITVTVMDLLHYFHQ